MALAMLFISWCGLFRETEFDTCALTVIFLFFKNKTKKLVFKARKGIVTICILNVVEI